MTTTIKEKKPISEVFHGDCMDYMRTIPNKFFDLCIADPPYGINLGGNLGSGDKSGIKSHRSWQYDKPTDECLQQIFRVSKNQIIWGGNYFNLPVCDNWIVWDKEIYGRSFAEGELAWCSIKKKLRIYKQNSTKIDTLKKIHPTQKPLGLYRWLLTNYAKAGDKIFDPYLGSGSHRIVAYKMGFDFYSCERDADYIKVSDEWFRHECYNEYKTQSKIITQQSLF